MTVRFRKSVIATYPRGNTMKPREIRCRPSQLNRCVDATPAITAGCPDVPDRIDCLCEPSSPKTTLPPPSLGGARLDEAITPPSLWNRCEPLMMPGIRDEVHRRYDDQPQLCRGHNEQDIPHVLRRLTLLMRLVLDQGDNHAVQVKEEHNQMEAKLSERLLWLRKLAKPCRHGKAVV